MAWRHSFAGVLLGCLALLAGQGAAHADGALRVLSFNIWGGGLHRGASINDTVAVLRATGADIIGLQEGWRPFGEGCASATCADNSISLACEIARALAFYCHDQASSDPHVVNAVLSRFPITKALPSGLGVRIDIAGRPLTLFNLHLPDAPYQPYQLLRIAYAGAPWLVSEAEAVTAARAARGHVLDRLEREIAALDDGVVIITGDFNEPSFRDWTARTAAVDLHPLAIAWPSTRRIEALGFIDSYRAVHPDEIAKPGFTWTVRPASEDHHDRIDFVFARGPGLQVEAVAIVGEAAPVADIVVAPWPSDHRAMLAILRFGPVRISSAERADDR